MKGIVYVSGWKSEKINKDNLYAAVRGNAFVYSCPLPLCSGGTINDESVSVQDKDKDS